LLKNLQVNISFAEALNKMSIYAKFMKEVMSRKKASPKEELVVLTKSCKAIFQGRLPLKKKDQKVSIILRSCPWKKLGLI